MEGLKLRKPFKESTIDLVAEPNGGEAIAIVNVGF